MTKEYDWQRYVSKVLYATFSTAMVYRVLRWVVITNSLSATLIAITGTALLMTIAIYFGSMYLTEFERLKKYLMRHLRGIAEFKDNGINGELSTLVVIFGISLLCGVFVGLILGIV